MSQLKLYGMKAAYDEIITTAVKRQHEPQQIVGDLLNAEISEKQVRSIKYQMTIAKLPLAKEVDGKRCKGPRNALMSGLFMKRTWPKLRPLRSLLGPIRQGAGHIHPVSPGRGAPP